MLFMRDGVHLHLGGQGGRGLCELIPLLIQHGNRVQEPLGPRSDNSSKVLILSS